MKTQTKTDLKLTDEDTRQEAVEKLSTYFPLEISGYNCTSEIVYDVLIKAAVTGQTIENVCISLTGENFKQKLNKVYRSKLLFACPINKSELSHADTELLRPTLLEK